jgi:hypothetical protein
VFRLAAIAMAAQFTLTAGAAGAQTDESAARAAFDEGVTAFTAENYPAALEAFERSFAKSPKASVLFNIGMCQKALYRYVDSLATFRRYLAEGGAKIKPARRAEVEKAIAEMEALAGTVRIHGAPPGAAVAIDGADRGRTPLAEPLAADPGKHVVEVRCDGYESFKKEILVSSETETVVSATLEKKEPETAVAALPAAPIDKSEPTSRPTSAAKPEPAFAKPPRIEETDADDASERKRRALGIGGGVALAAGAAGVVVGAVFAARGSKDAEAGADAAAAGDAAGRSAAIDDLARTGQGSSPGSRSAARWRSPAPPSCSCGGATGAKRALPPTRRSRFARGRSAWRSCSDGALRRRTRRTRRR